MQKYCCLPLHHSQLAFDPFFQGGKMHGIQSELPLPGFTKVGEGCGDRLSVGNNREKNEHGITT